jgi:hypothetical protein
MIESVAGGWRVNGLEQYLDSIVEPTFKDFERNPSSVRHAYLACVAAYHAVDRAAHPSHPGNLKKKWRDESFEFVIVDMVAHHFKHVISDDEKAPTPSGNIPLSTLVFGDGTLNSAPLNAEMFNEGGIDLHNLYFVIREAIKFLRQKAASKP